MIQSKRKHPEKYKRFKAVRSGRNEKSVYQKDYESSDSEGDVEVAGGCEEREREIHQKTSAGKWFWIIRTGKYL